MPEGVIGSSFSYGASHPVQPPPAVQGDAKFGLGIYGGVDKGGKLFENAVVPADTHAREVRRGFFEIFKNNPANDFSVKLPWTTIEGHKSFVGLYVQPENAPLLRQAAELALKNHAQINVWADGEVQGTVDPQALLNALPKS